MAVLRDALPAAAPDLAPVPSEFIRHELRAKAASIQAGISALAPSHLPAPLPRERMPGTLNVLLPSGVLPSYPTHVLVISAPASKHGSSHAEASLFPVHAVVLPAHCAKLPALPVLPITLPPSPAFAILHAWMYTGYLDAALASLLPSRPPSLPLSLLPTPPLRAPRLHPAPPPLRLRPTSSHTPSAPPPFSTTSNTTSSPPPAGTSRR
ncbi:hypothetical protein C8R45DRAFT_1220156 [Mycena sanguinolenta]|nr:hypothetical protein C8R45DRAFT_1220156 [Mycena sanguinolenta]